MTTNPTSRPGRGFPPSAFRRWVSVCAASACLSIVAGCQYEVISIEGEPFLANVPGATRSGSGPSPAGFGLRAAPRGPQGGADGGVSDAAVFTLEHDDGTVTRVRSTGRHLLYHIYQSLLNDDADVFVDELLGETTKAEFYERDVDPREAFRFLNEHEDQVALLMNAMPQGEFTPGLFLEPLGPGLMRLRASPRTTQGLPWRGIDMEWDGTGWRLRWFIRNRS